MKIFIQQQKTTPVKAWMSAKKLGGSILSVAEMVFWAGLPALNGQADSDSQSESENIEEPRT